MSKFAGRRFVTPASVETQVFDWGTIKWLSEPRVTGTEQLHHGRCAPASLAKATRATITRELKRFSMSSPAKASR